MDRRVPPEDPRPIKRMEEAPVNDATVKDRLRPHYSELKAALAQTPSLNEDKPKTRIGVDFQIKLTDIS